MASSSLDFVGNQDNNDVLNSHEFSSNVRVLVDENPKCVCMYVPNALDDDVASTLLEKLGACKGPGDVENCTALGSLWHQYTDDNGPQDRLAAYWGDTCCDFWFVGLLLHPAPWPANLPELLSARRAAQQAAEYCQRRYGGKLDATKLTSCLANYYRRGQGHIDAHGDEVRAHGEDKYVISISLGGPREFVLTERGGSQREMRLQLEHGSALVMRGEDMQTAWKHALPLEGNDAPARIGLTFRSIVPGYEHFVKKL